LRFSLGETYIWCPPHEGVDFDEFWMLGLREWIWIGKCFVSTLEFCWTLPMLQVWTGVWEFYISRATHRRLSWLRRQVVEQLRSILRLATSDGTPWMALKTSIVIGSVLIIINHGDSITQGKYPPLWKILLTYSVPFLVSTWGAISQKGKSLKPRNNIWIQHRASKTMSEYCCPVDGRAFDTYIELYQHLTIACHWQCGDCGELFCSENQCELHIRRGQCQ